MEALKEFVLPVRSLKSGRHEFNFDLDWQFFQHFEQCPIQQGRFGVDVVLEKDYDHWVVTFEIEGEVDTCCHRCLAPIALPVSGRYVVIVKNADDLVENEDLDIVYVTREALGWNVAQLIYEFVVLSIPEKHVYNCESTKPKPCDEEIITRLEQRDESSTRSERPCGTH